MANRDSSGRFTSGGGDDAVTVPVKVTGAEEGAKQVDKLSAALVKLGKAREAQAKSTPMTDQLLGSSGYAKLSNAVGKIFGQGAASKLDAAAVQLAEAGDKLGLSPEMLKAAGGAIATGGAAVATGAAALAAAGAVVAAAAGAVLYAGIKFGVEQTDAAETQKAIFKKIGGGGGYKVAVKVAADLGMDEAAAQAKVKALLNSGFKEGQVEQVIKVGIGLDETQGAGAGDKFAKTLETIRNAGKFDAKSIKAFAKEGINTGDVYDALAKKLGITKKEAETKVKAGTIDIDKGILAVLDAASQKTKGISDALANSLPALISRIKLKFGDLFKGFDISPIKGFLKNVSSVLDSGEGRAFGKAFGKLGSTVLELLFGPMAGASGKKGMTAIVEGLTSGVKKIAAYLNESKPTIKAAIGFIADLLAPKKGSDGPGAKVREMAADFMKLYTQAKPVIGVLLKIAGIALPVAFAVFTAATKVWGAALGFILKPISNTITVIELFVAKLTGEGPKAKKGGKAIADGVVSGLSGGLLSGMGKAIAAASAMASAVLARVKSVFDQHSPSKAFEFVGVMNGAGLAKGHERMTAQVKSSGAKLAGSALAGASSAAGKGLGASAGGGAGGPTFYITIKAAPGMTAGEARALGQAAGDGAYEAWKKNKRTFDREQQEGRAA